MSHFIFPYAGNKRNEYKHFKDYINYDGINNIVEPFCGTSAISFNIWLEHKGRFNYYLNDNSQLIYDTYLLNTDAVYKTRIRPSTLEKYNIKIKDGMYV